eukprot:gb/GECH01011360.1/.p1 GENE.gb/GECH01011360.1/~~gb/GECH01011360.1/.p1  ORF type:complete len:530 (+),score=115.50 gb/GECH01011360.1/:1-1590(+)
MSFLVRLLFQGQIDKAVKDSVNTVWSKVDQSAQEVLNKQLANNPYFAPLLKIVPLGSKFIKFGVAIGGPIFLSGTFMNTDAGQTLRLMSLTTAYSSWFFQVQPRPLCWVENPEMRQQIQSVLSNFPDGGESQRLFLVAGPSGIGKTTMMKDELWNRRAQPKYHINNRSTISSCNDDICEGRLEDVHHRFSMFRSGKPRHYHYNLFVPLAADITPTKDALKRGFSLWNSKSDFDQSCRVLERTAQWMHWLGRPLSIVIDDAAEILPKNIDDKAEVMSFLREKLSPFASIILVSSDSTALDRISSQSINQNKVESLQLEPMRYNAAMEQYVRNRAKELRINLSKDTTQLLSQLFGGNFNLYHSVGLRHGVNLTENQLLERLNEMKQQTREIIISSLELDKLTRISPGSLSAFEETLKPIAIAHQLSHLDHENQNIHLSPGKARSLLSSTGIIRPVSTLNVPHCSYSRVAPTSMLVLESLKSVFSDEFILHNIIFLEHKYRNTLNTNFGSVDFDTNIRKHLLNDNVVQVLQD